MGSEGLEGDAGPEAVVPGVDGGAKVALLVAACREKLPPQGEWQPFKGYQDSLALAVIDAIWAMIARYAITCGVIERYRRHRALCGADAYRDGIPELLDVFEDLGGVDRFIDTIGTRNRVSTQPGAARKGDAVFLAARSFRDLGVQTAEQFRAAVESDGAKKLQDAWRALPGQRSGISWRYLRMLLGLPDVKPDRMIVRFVASAIGLDESALTPDETAALVVAAAERLEVREQDLDHAIWESQSGRRGGHDPVARSDHLRSLAHAFVGAAFPALAEVRVLPPSIYHPYLHVGRDYFGGDARVPEGDELEAALKIAYSARFGKPLGSKDTEFPSQYMYSLVEASVARCARADVPFEADTAPVIESVEEMFTVLDSSDYTATCCRAVSHLSVVGGLAVQVGDVAVHPETGGDGLLRLVTRLIPAAPGSYNREPPTFHNPPHSLVVATTGVSGENPFDAWDRLRSRIRRFLLLVRLIYAGTPQSLFEMAGMATLVSRVHPQYKLLPGVGEIGMGIRREVTLSADAVPAFAALGALLDVAAVNRKGMASTSFDVAVYEFTRAYEPAPNADRLVALATALEAILTGNERETEAISFRLRSRAASLLATSGDPANVIFKDLSKLYDLRSRLVHGGNLKETDLRARLEGVSTVRKGDMWGVAWDFAVDRLRDLVRRAFLSRLCLAEGPDPLWPFEGTIAVDECLSDDSQRERWRTAWRERLSSLGAAAAAEAAAPGVDPIDPDR